MLVTVKASGIATPLIAAGDPPSLVVNRDLVNQIYYGYSESIVASSTAELSIIDPLGSVAFDGKQSIWAIAASGTSLVDVQPGATQWAPSPAQVAAQINALGLAKDTTLQTTNSNVSTVNTTLGTPSQRVDVQGLTIGGNPGGIPVLRGTTNKGVASGSTLAGAASATLLSAVTVDKPSFEAIFQIFFAAGAALPFLVVNVNWVDSNTGLTVGAKRYLLIGGNLVANTISTYISGPCRGNQVTLSVQNLDGLTSLTYTWAFNLTSHIYTIDRLLQPTYATVPNFGIPAGNPSKGVLFASQPSIGPSGTITRLTAASNAKCKLNIDNGAQANGCALTMADPGGIYDSANATQVFHALIAAAGTRAASEIQMPNGPLLVNMINQAGTNTITPSVVLTIMEYLCQLVIKSI